MQIKEQYGRLTIADPELIGVDKPGHEKLLMRCLCGRSKLVTLSSLHYGRTQSCGCLRAEKVAERDRQRNKLGKKNKPVKNLRTGAEYPSTSEAARALGYSRPSLVEHLRARSNGEPPKCYKQDEWVYQSTLS
jgi:hypothetical protein